ncbi:MAG: exopolysaccharide biosynthesis protein [Firmicutes bacterium]|nr:exopolysaccharide biosynthesis protein [Bacillota bacterium]
MTDEKIIIFGMGSILKKRLNQFDFTKIIALTDNYVMNKGEEYANLQVIRPEEIKSLEFDLVIICTGYVKAKEIYYQLSEVFQIPETKIMSERKYFEKISWEPKSFLEICHNIGIRSIRNVKKYFYSNGILSNTNVFGENFADITWKESGIAEAILLGEIHDETSLENIFDEFKEKIYKYKDSYKFIIIILNMDDKEQSNPKTIEGYSLKYISGLDIQLMIYQKQEPISIYVATHKNYRELSEKIYTTLWLGDKKNNNISYLKEEGDNISYLNHKINECTGLYWIWKHAKEEIIGLNHYRRFFKHSQKNEVISEKDVRSILEDYDIIVVNATYTYPMTISENLENSIDSLAFERSKHLVLNAISKLQPDYMESFIDIMDGYAFFPCNMFITNKTIFDKYCKWFFSIIIPAAECFDETPFDQYSKRAIGFFAERLLTVWLYKHDYYIKELPMLLNDTTL